MAKSAMLLVGTKKGLYTMRSDDRRKWSVDGPYGAPAPIHHATFDPRDQSMYAAINSTWGGARIEYSRDLGKTWTASKTPGFPAGSDRTFYQTWHIEPGHAKTPNVVWAGTEPAALWKSVDRGETWTLNQALDDQPSRAKWVPGFGGMGLPTSLGFSAAIHPNDPETAWCIPLHDLKRTCVEPGIAVFKATDRAATWTRNDAGLPKGAPLESLREAMHNDLFDDVGVYFGTANGDVYASLDEGKRWDRIAQYLPYVV